MSTKAFIKAYAISQGATDMIIGMADMGNAYRYRLSVSADKKSYIGSLTDIL